MTLNRNEKLVIIGIGLSAMFVGLVVTLILVGPPPVNYTCYNGHKYKVDAQGVMWPVQTKFGVQKCEE